MTKFDVRNSKVLDSAQLVVLLGEDFMNLRFMSNLMLAVGTCALILLAGAGTASASVPELDPGSAASGTALAVGAALLLVERYRRRN